MLQTTVCNVCAQSHSCSATLLRFLSCGHYRYVGIILVLLSLDTCKRVQILPFCADNRIRHIPVVEDKGMKGMVSIGDVVRAVVHEHREELERLSSYIQGGY